MLSNDQKQYLFKMGFSSNEIRSLDEKDNNPIDLNSPQWESTITSRQSWFLDKIEKGWTDNEIYAAIQSFYNKDKNRTPWDFLKAAYRPPKKVDYFTAIKNRTKTNPERARNIANKKINEINDSIPDYKHFAGGNMGV